MSTSPWLALALTLPVIFVFWTLSSTSASPFASSFPRLYNKRICLLIAHPDDEAMFFAPTLLALTRPELGNHVKILCLSSGMFSVDRVAFSRQSLTATGDADGLGHIRKKELQESALRLGLRNESDVFIVDDPARFPDSMTTMWSATEIASVLASAFAPGLSSSSKSSGSSTNSAPNATIDVLLTFDQHGISNHPNHRSLYHGAVAFLRTLMKGKSGYSCPVALYTLTTTNIVRKYSGVLDAPVTMLWGALGNVRDALTASAAAGGGRTKSKSKTRKERNAPNRLLFVNSVGEWLRARSAMVEGHRSQMLWFRWGWITIGRYMVVNDLKREEI